jgi:hypothetical protein
MTKQSFDTPAVPASNESTDGMGDQHDPAATLVLAADLSPQGALHWFGAARVLHLGGSALAESLKAADYVDALALLGTPSSLRVDADLSCVQSAELVVAIHRDGRICFATPKHPCFLPFELPRQQPPQDLLAVLERQWPSLATELDDALPLPLIPIHTAPSVFDVIGARWQAALQQWVRRHEAHIEAAFPGANCESVFQSLWAGGGRFVFDLMDCLELLDTPLQLRLRVLLLLPAIAHLGLDARALNVVAREVTDTIRQQRLLAEDEDLA